ncbi:ABC transporter permease [Aliidongia dinghuensis]|uniref:ABC transporter permease n=1 Tax=Aliidongia dinghuensis TaxID=1867774 RepID=A0A8J2YSE4_9PROT|nr:ABC transporter permease [Aliidongia dinghuensis]GGF14117.1 ABC transporter permease [Aliidongia dinghuensis]
MVPGKRLGERLGRLAYGAAVWGGFGFLIVPILLVLWLSFFSNEILTLPPDGYSLRWYTGLLGKQDFVDGFLLSLEVALLATAAGLAVSLPASLVLVRARFAGREVLLNFLMAPLIVPAIVIGAALYIFFIQIEIVTDIPLAGSLPGLVGAHVLLTIPWCIRLLTANLVGLDPAIEEAAASLGAHGWTVIRKVTLPLVWPGLVAAALFAFVVSFGNLEISLFLVAPGETTLPIAILQYLEWKLDPTIAAVSTLQVLLIGAGLVATDRMVGLARVV